MKSLWNDDGLCEDLSRKGLLQSSRWNQSEFNKRLQNIIVKILERERKTP
jgi:hypothetical protein